MVRNGWHSGCSKDTDRQTHANETETETVTEDDSECGGDATTDAERRRCQLIDCKLIVPLRVSGGREV